MKFKHMSILFVIILSFPAAFAETKYSYFNHFENVTGWIMQQGLMNGRCDHPILQKDSIVYAIKTAATGMRAGYVELDDPIVPDKKGVLEVEIKFRYDDNGGWFIGLMKNNDYICESYYHNDGFVFEAVGEGSDKLRLRLGNFTSNNDASVKEITYYNTHNDNWHTVKLIRNETGYWSMFIDGIHRGTGTHQDLDNNYKYLSVQAYGSANAIAEIDYIDVKFTPSPETLIEKYSPVLYFDPGERYFPMNISSLMDSSDLKQINVPGFFDPLPTEIEELSGKNKNHFMDNPDVDVYDFLTFPETSELVDYPYTVYARKVKNQINYTALQYYFFYPYNVWNNKHEGDWEMVQVILDDKNEFVSASHNFHYLTGDVEEKEHMEWYNDTHPVVLVAEGGHASYFEWEPQGPSSFCNKLLIKMRRIESLSKNGKILHHNSVEFSSGDVEEYDIKLIDESKIWINFTGHWGEVPEKIQSHSLKEEFKYMGSKGPTGPKFIKYYFFKDRWKDPFSLVKKPSNLALAVMFLLSPADIHVYDTSGNHVGISGTEIDEDIPGLYYYTGPGKDPESLMLFGEDNYTIELQGTGTGLVNFQLFYYHPEKGGIVLNYTDVPFTINTIGTIQVNSDSDFKMILGDQTNIDPVIDYEGFESGTDENNLIPEFSFYGIIFVVVFLLFVRIRKQDK
ncbi:hypothetical protein GF327_10460 [Candidatus Woesearchaeota archaeon]|nr:hypothetical protein [Candidatus Woesearchaeota archaeon]